MSDNTFTLIIIFFVFMPSKYHPKCFDILQSTKLTAGVILLTLKDYLSS